MIFVTVGTDLPFNRLMHGVDRWARENKRGDVFAQIGEGGWKPEAVDFAEFLEPPEFEKRFEEAQVIVAHAGMGTILSALHAGKPILVMPRRASLGEQRNEHQLATAKHMAAKGNVSVAYDEAQLFEGLDNLHELLARPPIGKYAAEGLVKEIRNFIFQK